SSSSALASCDHTGPSTCGKNASASTADATISPPDQLISKRPGIPCGIRCRCLAEFSAPHTSPSARLHRPYHPMVDSVVRLISPFPPAEVRERIAGDAKSRPLLGHWGFARLHKGFWGLGSWMRLRRDQGVRARFVADDEVVLEQRIQFMD